MADVLQDLPPSDITRVGSLPDIPTEFTVNGHFYMGFTVGAELHECPACFAIVQKTHFTDHIRLQHADLPGAKSGDN